MSSHTTITIIRDAHGVAIRREQPRFSLRVLNGVDRRREKSSTCGRLLVGSGPGADLQLTDSTVSALHCELSWDERGLRLRDLGSKNGVRQNGRMVLDAYVEDGDELKLGATSLRVRVLEGVDEQPLSPRTSFGRLRGSSPRMRELYMELDRAAHIDAPVLLVGETGTGKELAAEGLVFEGPRRDKPLGVLECARLSPELADAELFGYVAGAFTGAVRSTPGLFEQNHGGTVLLDHVDELSLALQPKLLGVLERRSVQRIGGSERIPVDVRVLATTRRELEREVNRGTFRADLYFRLAALQVRLPTLAEHPEDIPELVEHFLSELPDGQAPSPSALRELFVREYPGNVRELRNTVERFALGFAVAPRPLAPVAGAPIDLSLPYHQHKERVLGAFQRDYIGQLLLACKGNYSEAARRSGLDRMHVHKLSRRHGLSGDEPSAK